MSGSNPYVAIDLGTIPPATMTIQVKTCKSGRHQYYGTRRCPACKKIYDQRYHRIRRLLKAIKMGRYNLAHLNAYAVPPVMMGNNIDPRSRIERGEYLLEQALAAGLDPFTLGPEIQAAAMRRHRMMIGAA